MNLFQNKVSWLSVTLTMLMHGFFGKKQYEAIAPSMFTTKFSKERCLECSTCAMFFSSSLMVSIIARFLRSTLSETLIIAPFMLLLSFVISWIPQANSLLNSSPSWYSLCHQPTFRISDWWTIHTQAASCHQHRQGWTRSSGAHLSHCRWDAAWSRRTIPWNICRAVLFPWRPCGYVSSGSCTPWAGCCQRNWFRYTCRAGLSWWRWPVERQPPFPVLRICCMKRSSGKDARGACKLYPYRNVSGICNRNRETVSLSA